MSTSQYGLAPVDPAPYQTVGAKFQRWMKGEQVEGRGSNTRPCILRYNSCGFDASVEVCKSAHISQVLQGLPICWRDYFGVFIPPDVSNEPDVYEVEGTLGSIQLLWKGIVGKNYLIIENIARAAGGGSGEFISELSHAMFTNWYRIDDLKYIVFPDVSKNENTRVLVESYIHQDQGPSDEPQEWTPETPQFKALLGTELGKVVCRLVLGSWQPTGNFTVGRAITWGRGHTYEPNGGGVMLGMVFEIKRHVSDANETQQQIADAQEKEAQSAKADALKALGGGQGNQAELQSQMGSMAGPSNPKPRPHALNPFALSERPPKQPKLKLVMKGSTPQFSGDAAADARELLKAHGIPLNFLGDAYGEAPPNHQAAELSVFDALAGRGLSPSFSSRSPPTAPLPLSDEVAYEEALLNPQATESSVHDALAEHGLSPSFLDDLPITPRASPPAPGTPIAPISSPLTPQPSISPSPPVEWAPLTPEAAPESSADSGKDKGKGKGEEKGKGNGNGNRRPNKRRRKE